MILNRYLPWDGAHLGTYNDTIITTFMVERTKYSILTFNNGRLYTMMRLIGDSFPLIIEDIREMLSLSIRKYHLIKICGKEYILYYVPVINEDVIWEVPLNKIPRDHNIRNDPTFRRRVQKLFIFCEIMSLSRTTESSISIRCGEDGTYYPINTNDISTPITKDATRDYTVLASMTFNNWLKDEDIVGIIGSVFLNTREESLASLRFRLDDIITRHNSKYLWYSRTIIERLDRYSRAYAI